VHAGGDDRSPLAGLSGFNGRFQVNLDYPVLPRFPSFTCSGTESLGDQWQGTVPFLSLNQQCKNIEETSLPSTELLGWPIVACDSRKFSKYNPSRGGLPSFDVFGFPFKRQ